MIIGACPYCDAVNITPIGDPPCFSKEACDSCGEVYWLKHSRYDPKAYTEDDFNAEFYIDKNKVICYRKHEP